jgi:hypothetical protein
MIRATITPIKLMIQQLTNRPIFFRDEVNCTRGTTAKIRPSDKMTWLRTTEKNGGVTRDHIY